MFIKLSPVRAEDTIEVSVSGDVLHINGESFDFSQLPDGATLPSDAIGSFHFVGPVERVNGELRLTLRMPHGPNPALEVAFPEPISVTDGVVTLPGGGHGD